MTDEIVEEWRPVVGYEGFYEVSSLGRVRSLERTAIRPANSQIARDVSISLPPRNKKLWIDAHGYVRARLSRPGSYTTKTVSRLMGESFLGARKDQCVDHIDGDRRNNYLTNLRLCSSAENARNKKRRSDSKQPYKGIFKRGRKWFFDICALQIREVGGPFASPEEAHAAYCAAAKRLHGDFARYF